MSDIKLFSSDIIGESYYKIDHGSGLVAYVYPKNMSTSYGILSVGFGGRVTEYISSGERVTLPEGCAHFLEHKMFENSDGSCADDYFSRLGAYDNAYTSSERTAYLFSATEYEYECVQQLLTFVTDPYFTKKTVKKEIGIISEEIRGCFDDPYDRCYMNMLSAMYKNDPVKTEICGSESSISRITPEVLYRCCRDFYVPSNMVLSLCGNFEPERVVEIADRVLGTSARECHVSSIGFDEPSEVVSPRTVAEMSVGKPLFCIGVKDVEISDNAFERYKKTEGMNVLLNVMFSESGEFYLKMLESGLLSPGFDSGYSSSPSTAYVMMSGESDDPDALLEMIKEHIRSCRKNGIDREAFEREKKCVYASYVSDFDATEDIAFALTSYAYDGMELFSYPKIISDITAEYVEELLENSFKEEYFTLSTVMPQGRKKEDF